MGCVSSSFLEDEDRIVRPALGHHIVSLTSTTYGLLTTLDHPSPTPPQTAPPPPPPPPPPSTLLPILHRSEPEIINSWELMAGLDSSTPYKSPFFGDTLGKENSVSHSHRMLHFSTPDGKQSNLRPSNAGAIDASLDVFEKKCPPGGELAAVLYTTTLRGIRKTFEDCNAVRSALHGLGVAVKERDVSMDSGFLQELRRLMEGSKDGCVVPRLFVRGRYIGGVEEVMRMHEEGELARLVGGLQKVKGGAVCDGCGGVTFLPCFQCSGSRKVVVVVLEMEKCGGKVKVVRCPECNENGLVLCPICS